MQATKAVDCRDTIGEGPVWDAVAQRALWLDNAIGLIHEAKADGSGGYRETRQWNLNRPTGAAIPRARGGLVVVGATEVFFVDEAGKTAPFARIDADPADVHINDAKCDPQGRLWFGTIANDFSPGRGCLYRVDADGSVSTQLRGVNLSNGMDWSPDGRTFYFIDSAAGVVDAFDFDTAGGRISKRRTVVSVARGTGAPDGMTVDAQGDLWVAVPATGQIRRYSPEGTQVAQVDAPVQFVTSCAFGGADGQDLLITSGAIRLPPPILPMVGFTDAMADAAAAAPGAGALYVCRTGVKGRPATPFAG